MVICKWLLETHCPFRLLHSSFFLAQIKKLCKRWLAATEPELQRGNGAGSLANWSVALSLPRQTGDDVDPKANSLGYPCEAAIAPKL